MQDVSQYRRASERRIIAYRVWYSLHTSDAWRPLPGVERVPFDTGRVHGPIGPRESEVWHTGWWHG